MTEALTRQTIKGPLPEMVRDPRDVITLTQRLVQTPSYRNVKGKSGDLLPEDQRVDERGVNTYIVDFLQRFVPGIQIQLQELRDGSGRFNVIATRGEDPKLLLLGHTDTVVPSAGGKYDQLGGEIVDSKLYGLGSTDMKGGVASALSAMSLADKDIPLAAIFYADEEYDFEGMKRLIEDSLPGISPDLLLSLDGSNMQLGTACRGIIQMRGTIRGVSAHAKRPEEGIDAISGVEGMLQDLRTQLATYTTDTLGLPTVNRATLQGGKEFKGNIIEQPNAIPDIANFVLDIRTSSPAIGPEKIKELITEYCKANNLRFDPDRDIATDFAYGAWITDKDNPQIRQVAQIFEEVTGQQPEFSDPKRVGYIDMQMLWDTLGQPAAVMIGPGESTMAHKPDEYVEIKRLEQCRDVVLRTIENYGRRSRVTELGEARQSLAA